MLYRLTAEPILGYISKTDLTRYNRGRCISWAWLKCGSGRASQTIVWLKWPTAEKTEAERNRKNRAKACLVFKPS